MPNHILLNSLNFFSIFIYFSDTNTLAHDWICGAGVLDMWCAVCGGARTLCWECNTRSVRLYVVLLVYLCTSRWYNTLARFINATQFIEFIRIERLALNYSFRVLFYSTNLKFFFPFDFVHSVFFGVLLVFCFLYHITFWSNERYIRTFFYPFKYYCIYCETEIRDHSLKTISENCWSLIENKFKK